MTYRFLPHTADIAVELEAERETGLQAAGIAALRELLVGLSEVRATDERPIEPYGATLADRVIHYLSEALYLYEVHRFVPAAAGGAGVLGEPFDPRRHSAAREVKAVTYHGATVRNDGGMLRLTVVFDV
jgi:SHS2 domain-containing protein